MDEQALIKVYDPKVTAAQMQSDINYLNTRSEKQNTKCLVTENDPYVAIDGAHAVAVLSLNGMNLEPMTGTVFTIICINQLLFLMVVIFWTEKL